MANSSMVVIHSSNELYGADRILLEVVRTAVHAHIDVTVWLPGDAPEGGPLPALLEQIGARSRVVPLPILRRSSLRPRRMLHLLADFLRTWRRLRSARPDVVYLATSACLLTAPIARLSTGRVVLHIQEEWSGAFRPLLRVLSASVTDVVGVSEWVVGQLPRTLKRRTMLVRNAEPDIDRPLVGLEQRDGSLKLLIASRWNRRKGHETLLRAWAIAGQPHVLMVAGGPPPLGDSVDVAGLARELGLADRVTIVGEVDDLSFLIDECDAVLVPSDEPEAFGLVAIEGFRRGRAVIAAASGGLAEIVTDGSNGLVFPSRDIEALADILSKLNRGTLSSMGEIARSTYVREFGIDEYERKFAQFWREVLAG